MTTQERNERAWKRFEPKVDFDGPIPEIRPDLGACWLWTAGVSVYGYGDFWNGSKRVRAHRFAYEHLIGPIPDGLDLDHLCRTRSCVNPGHLEAVTHRVNVLRGEGPTARHARKTHCNQGHPFDSVNTYIEPPGFRRCRTCVSRKSKLWHQAKKGATS